MKKTMKKGIALGLVVLLLIAVVGTVVADGLRAGQSVHCVDENGMNFTANHTISVEATVTSVNRYNVATVKFNYLNYSGRYIGWVRFTVTPYFNDYNGRNYLDWTSKTVSELVQGNLLTRGSFTLSGWTGNIDGFRVSWEPR